MRAEASERDATSHERSPERTRPAWGPPPPLPQGGAIQKGSLVGWLAVGAALLISCGHPSPSTIDSDSPDRRARVTILERAIASDHATLEALLSRPSPAATHSATTVTPPATSGETAAAVEPGPLSSKEAAGLHLDPRLRAIAERLTRNRRELSELRKPVRVEAE